ncbi:uncharacterized protein LOC131959138 [Centropristis striata]|uniref:uncharacterized protein LOC131959138 n=1 Tax=Centropristis striata TaxID=184440 RepID=UPI0027E1747A|nr:uncharacterized protein LOC131959138 [Centropristis striata]
MCSTAAALSHIPIVSSHYPPTSFRNARLDFERIPSDEIGEMRCSDLDLPMLTSDTVSKWITPHLNDIKAKQWTSLHINIDNNTVMILSNICHEITETVSNLVLDDVMPQVYQWMENINNPSKTSAVTNRIKSPYRNRNYHTITVEDIEACLGNSLHQSLGEFLGVIEESCRDSEQLLHLVAEEVAKQVNRTLIYIRESFSSQQVEQSFEFESPLSPTQEMVYHMSNILRRCLVKQPQPNLPDERSAQEFSPISLIFQLPQDLNSTDEESAVIEFSPESSPDDKNMVQELSTEDDQDFLSETPDEGSSVKELSQASSPDDDNMVWEFSTDDDNDSLTETHHEFPDEESPVKELSQAPSPDDDNMVRKFSTEDDNDSLWETQLELPDQRSPVKELSQAPSRFAILSSVLSTSRKEFTPKEKIFLSVFVCKLLDHIAHSTKTSAQDLDFDGIVKNLMKILGEKSFCLPQTVGNLHITIFKELCLEFGSAKQLCAAMICEGVVFEEAVAKELKRQLQKASCPSFVTKVFRFFKIRSKKVVPIYEVNTSVSQSGVLLENGSTPLPQKKKKCPAIIGMFSAIAKILRKPFTS